MLRNANGQFIESDVKRLERKFILLTFIVSFLSLNLFAQNSKLGATPSWTKGNSNAKIKIEVFNDYQCPPCAIFNVKLKRIEEEFPNDLQITFRQFPLVATHNYAMLAAQAVEAAGKQGKFREMADLLLERQRKWEAQKSANDAFVYYAKKLKLNVAMFKSDLESQQVKDRIKSDVERARFLELSGTPTVLFNGRKLEFWEMDDLEKLIKENLSK